MLVNVFPLSSSKETVIVVEPAFLPVRVNTDVPVDQLVSLEIEHISVLADTRLKVCIPSPENDAVIVAVEPELIETELFDNDKETGVDVLNEKLLI